MKMSGKSTGVFYVSGNNSIILWLILIAVALLGLYLMVYGLQAVLWAHESSHWPPVQATIVKSEIVGYKHRSPTIVFNYAIGEKNLSSSTISPGATAFNGNPYAIIKRFPKGSQQPAYVPPDDPSKAFLETGIHPHNFDELVAGSLCFTFALVLLLSNWLVPKYGKKRPNGTFTVAGNSIISKLGTLGMLLVFVQFALLWWLVTN